MVVVVSALEDEVAEGADPGNVFLNLGLPLGAGASYDAPAAHWADATKACDALLENLFDLCHRRLEVGDSQGETVLNTTACASCTTNVCQHNHL